MRLKILSESFVSFIKAIHSITPEAGIHFTEHGISCKSVDPANVSMVAVELQDSAFELLESPDIILGCDIVKLKDILDSADKSEIIELSLNDESHKLNVNLRGISYSMGLIDPDSIRKEPKIPALDLPFQITLTGDQFLRGLKAGEKVSDYVLMGCRDSNDIVFFIEAEGDTDKMTLELRKDEVVAMTPAIVKSLYSLEYLTKIAGIVGKNELTLKLGMDLPLMISTKFADGRGTVEFMLAPRVGEN